MGVLLNVFLPLSLAVIMFSLGLGGVAGFDQDEGCSEGYESPGVPRRFFRIVARYA